MDKTMWQSTVHHGTQLPVSLWIRLLCTGDPDVKSVHQSKFGGSPHTVTLFTIKASTRHVNSITLLRVTWRAPGAPYSNKRLCLLELRSRLAADPRAEGATIWMRPFGDRPCPGNVHALEVICRFTTTGGPGFGTGAALTSPAGARPAVVHGSQNQSPYTSS